MKIFVSHDRGYDFKQLLYKPLRNSKLNKIHDIFLPHEDSKDMLTMNVIKKSDIFVCEASYPSTGQGIEIGWAYAFKIPIVAMFKKERKISGSLKYVTKTIIEYENTEDMLEKLSDALKSKDRNSN